MSTFLGNCPPSTAIETTPTPNCKQNWGRTSKFLFQRVADSGTDNAIVIATTNPNVLATWTALKTAADSTKVSVSPFVQNPETTPGTKRTYGGGNQTLYGIPIVIGSEPTEVTAEIHYERQDVIESLKKLMNEDGNIGVFLVNESGHIAGLTDDIDTPTTFKPIPIRGLFVGDKGFGGRENVDMNAIEFMFEENWSDKFHVVSPTDFNGNDL